MSDKEQKKQISVEQSFDANSQESKQSKDPSFEIKQTLAKLEELNQNNEGRSSSRFKQWIPFALIALLFIPFPQKSGGEFEIEGNPGTETAYLRASVPAIVDTVYVQAGQKVSKGTLIAELANWEIEEKRLDAQKELAYLKSTKLKTVAQSQSAEADYQRALHNYEKYQAKQVFFDNQKELLNANLPARLRTTAKELQKVQLQTESMVNKAALYSYLSEQGVYPLQLASEAQYEAASLAKQEEVLAAQLNAETEELLQEQKEKQYEAKEALMLAQSNKAKIGEATKSVASIDAQINGLTSLLELYNKQSNSLSLVSPIDGTVLTLNTDELVGQSFAKGDIVAVVGDLDNVEIKIQLPEEEIAYINIGDEATVRARGVPNAVFNGTIQTIAPVTSELDEQTQVKRIFELSIILDNSKQQLKPGMTGYAVIHTKNWKSLASNAWDEVYRVFKLERYLDRNPLSFVGRIIED